jgi:D-alanyl-D-alanine carboxypeptidase/D-alanyl-D-alanine-endopeptidase (penicillin-binding protein 4)
MRGFAILLAAVAAASGADPKPSALDRQIERLIQASPAAARAFWGVQVVSLSTGKTLAAINAGRLFAPASNTKLFTSAVALAELGPDHHFETTVTAQKPPDAAGRLAGDLRLVGGGDPSLASVEDLADQVVASGVRRIDGDIVGDDTAYVWEPYPEGWAQDDTLWDYGAPVSALALNGNLVSVRVRATHNRTAVALSPPFEYYALDNRVRADPHAEDKVHLERLPGSRQLRLWGALRPHAETQFLVAIDDPALYAACVLADALERRGVAIAGRPVAEHRYPHQRESDPEAAVLARHSSPELAELLRTMDKASVNLYAEMFLREVGRREGAGSRAAGIDTLRRFLAGAGIAAPEYNFADGSGLSGSNLVSPEAVVKLLRFMHKSARREVWMSLLPVGGQDGTLAGRFNGAEAASRVHAKTGTLTHASALSGYVQSASRGTLAFSILVNNYSASTADVRAVIDRIALELAE